MNTCTCCFEDYIVKCNDNINVYAQLEPTTGYMWVITDKFNRQYSGTFTTDADGFWQIPVADLPAGLLTEFSGQFKLQVFFDLPDTQAAPVNFKIATITDCITFNVHAGTRVKDFLGVEF